MKSASALALLAALAVSLDPGGLLAKLEGRTVDARYRHFARASASSERIVILDITEESIERLRPVYGRWPWPRSLHGEVAEYLAKDGAAAVGFDLLFADADSRPNAEAADWEALEALAQNADIAEVRGELVRRMTSLKPGLDDGRFVESVARAGNVFQAAVFAGGTGATAAPSGPALRPPPSVPIGAEGDDAVSAEAIFPFDGLAAASRGIGHINVRPDADGSYRHFAPLAWWGDRRAAYPALAVAIAAHVKGVPLAAVRRSRAGLTIGDTVLPLRPDGSAWINYQRGTLYRHIPYEDVLATKDLHASGREGPLAPGTFDGKIVLVSAQAPGLSDLRATPFSPVTPGVEIHANIIDSLLARRFLDEPRPATELLVTLAACLAVALPARSLRPRLGLPIALAATGGLLAVAWLSFGQGWVLRMVHPVVGVAIACGGALFFRTVSVERERRWLRTAFGHYLAPAVLEEVLRSPDKLRLGGERRRMTVLFSDIAGFTTFSESRSPEAISSLLNGYLDRMTDCVARTGGTLDKFVGDAVMAEWNAPAAQPDHAARACETALLMLEEVRASSSSWREAGGALDIRIGINTGEMVVGNMGSRQVFDYTVIGNEVNTAARLEPLNKVFGTRIIVAGATRADAEQQRPGGFAFRPLGRVMPKGRCQPLEIFELVGRRSAEGGPMREELAAFTAAMERFLSRDFAEARRRFLDLLGEHPDDGPAALFASLCAEYLERPPAEDWSGVLEQTDK